MAVAARRTLNMLFTIHSWAGIVLPLSLWAEHSTHRTFPGSGAGARTRAVALGCPAPAGLFACGNVKYLHFKRE